MNGEETSVPPPATPRDETTRARARRLSPRPRPRQIPKAASPPTVSPPLAVPTARAISSTIRRASVDARSWSAEFQEASRGARRGVVEFHPRAGRRPNALNVRPAAAYDFSDARDGNGEVHHDVFRLRRGGGTSRERKRRRKRPAVGRERLTVSLDRPTVSLDRGSDGRSESRGDGADRGGARQGGASLRSRPRRRSRRGGGGRTRAGGLAYPGVDGAVAVQKTRQVVSGHEEAERDGGRVAREAGVRAEEHHLCGAERGAVLGAGQDHDTVGVVFGVEEADVRAGLVAEASEGVAVRAEERTDAVRGTEQAEHHGVGVGRGEAGEG